MERKSFRSTWFNKKLSTIEVTGKINPFNLRDFSSALDLYVSSGSENLTLNFQRVTVAYPNGMLPIIAAIESLRRTGKKIYVKLPNNDNVRRMFRSVNWAHFLSPEQYEKSESTHDRHLVTQFFDDEIKQHKALNDEVYLQRGPIVFAYEIPHKEETIKTYSKANYKDYYCFPTNEDFKNLKFTSDSKFELKSNSNYNSFYDSQWNLKSSLYNTSKNENQDVTLIPIGKTVLRRVTFPILETSN